MPHEIPPRSGCAFKAGNLLTGFSQFFPSLFKLFTMMIRRLFMNNVRTAFMLNGCTGIDPSIQVVSLDAPCSAIVAEAKKLTSLQSATNGWS